MILNLINIILIACMTGLQPPKLGEPDPEMIISETRSIYRSIRDFSAEVEIEININFVNIPNKTAEILYKYPDKIKFKSSSFIMIPKKGIGCMMFSLLEMKCSAIYIGKTFHNGHELHQIKLIPMGEDSDVVLATLFIDASDHLIYYLEATTKDAGFFSTEFEYGDHTPLPDKNLVRFEVDEVRLPLKFLGKVDPEKSENKEGIIGEVILRYNHYKLNQGFDNGIFIEKNGAEK